MVKYHVRWDEGPCGVGNEAYLPCIDCFHKRLSCTHIGVLCPIAELQGEYGSANYRGKSVGLLRPITFMNNSGQSIRKVSHFHEPSIHTTSTFLNRGCDGGHSIRPAHDMLVHHSTRHE